MMHPTRDALERAIADANRGHRPHEWERVAADLGRTAREYIEHVESVRGLLPMLDLPTPTTRHGQHIIEVLLPEWVAQFVGKSNDYGETANDLGAAGQYADMNRKMGKLKRALWHGETLTGEQPREILMDLIGHCFLTIHYIDKGDNGR